MTGAIRSGLSSFYIVPLSTHSHSTKKQPQVIDFVKLGGNKAHSVEATGVTPGVTPFLLPRFVSNQVYFLECLRNNINVFTCILSTTIDTIF